MLKKGEGESRGTGLPADYGEYHFGRKEWLAEAGTFLLLDAVCAWLFYNSFIAFGVMLPLIAVWMKYEEKKKAGARRQILTADFRDALNVMTVSLRAGRAVEQAVRETASELGIMKGKDACITKEFRYIAGQITMSVSAEKLFEEFAARSGVEEIRDFAAVFAAAKRTGGNMPAILRRAAETIEGRIDVEMEIETTVSAKKLEQRIMSVMPAGIIFYMRISSPGFLDLLYGNLFGVLAMTAALAVYGISIIWGSRIVRIEV